MAFLQRALQRLQSIYLWVLSLDHIWNLIIYAFAKYVDKHAGDFEVTNFVAHEGKKNSVVTAPASFQMTESNNPHSGASAKEWETFVFPDFSTQIKDHIGQDTHSFLTARFSKTTAASMEASEITLMSTMKNYFSYEKRTQCGIPTLH